MTRERGIFYVNLRPDPQISDLEVSISRLEARNLFDPVEVGIVLEEIKVIVDGGLSDQGVEALKLSALKMINSEKGEGEFLS